jgi:hypothetical protein
MLTSVSRRDPARAAADVWTSGNRIFRCRGTELFRIIVSAIGIGDDPEEMVAAELGRDLSREEASLVCLAAEQAVELVQLEEWEVAEYVAPDRETKLAHPVRGGSACRRA